MKKYLLFSVLGLVFLVSSPAIWASQEDLLFPPPFFSTYTFIGGVTSFSGESKTDATSGIGLEAYIGEDIYGYALVTYTHTLIANNPQALGLNAGVGGYLYDLRDGSGKGSSGVMNGFIGTKITFDNTLNETPISFGVNGRFRYHAYTFFTIVLGIDFSLDVNMNNISDSDFVSDTLAVGTGLLLNYSFMFGFAF
jgi:hypothetical protein